MPSIKIFPIKFLNAFFVNILSYQKFSFYTFLYRFWLGLGSCICTSWDLEGHQVCVVDALLGSVANPTDTITVWCCLRLTLAWSPMLYRRPTYMIQTTS